jgi:hypothetical protein
VAKEEEEALGLILRSYARRIAIGFFGVIWLTVVGMAAMFIGGWTGGYFGLSKDATMWVMLGVFFMPLLIAVWWPRGAR